ncbi:MAG: hypothetical protein V2A58_07665 [Planctomycetota bacterium]
MLDINLLPEEYKVAEGTPKPRLMTTLVGTIIVTVMLVFWGVYHFTVYKIAGFKRDSLAEEVKSNEQKVQEYQRLGREIARLGKREETVKEVWQDRVVWSKKIDQLIDLVPSHVWLKRIMVRGPEAVRGVRGDELAGAGKLILECVSASGDPRYVSDFFRVLLGERASENNAIERSREFAADFVALGHDGGKRVEYEVVTPEGSKEKREGWAVNITLFFKPPAPAKPEKKPIRSAGEKAT